MNPITLRRELHCRSAPRALWAMLASAEALQRALGQIALPYRLLDDKDALFGGFEFHSARAGSGFVELPAEWRSGESLLLVRRYRTGMLTTIATRFNLTPVGQTSKLEIILSLTPRRGALRPLLRLYGELSLRQICKTLARLDAAQFRGENPARVVSPLDATLLATAVAALRTELSAEERAVLEQLTTHLRGLDDLDALRILPLALAEAWEKPAPTVLSVCLAATGHGLLELRWDVVCASCRLPALRLANLAELVESVTCPRCAIEIPVDIERTVEVSFDLASALKPAAARPIVRGRSAYARSSPHRTPHIIVQELLPAAGRATLRVPTEPGEYRLFLRGGATGRLNVSTLGPPSAQLLASSVLEPSTVEVAMGGSLEIAHEHAQPRLLQLSRLDAAAAGASAHTVTLHPRFRRLFRAGRDAQRLPPGMLLPVSRVALLQSELLGTLELCKAVGEKAALALVEEHLELLGDIVEREQGSLVHRDREGIAAAFADETQAARVALLLLQAFMAFREGQANPPSALGLRIGLFGGPCHLCTLAGAIEYFGTTQLVCLRLLREAHAGDIVLAAELAEKLAASGSQSAPELPAGKAGPRFALSVRGLDAPLPVVRMRIE